MDVPATTMMGHDMEKNNTADRRRERGFVDSLRALDRYLLNEILMALCDVKKNGERWSQGEAIAKTRQERSDGGADSPSRESG